MTYDSRRGYKGEGRKPSQSRRWSNLRGQTAARKLHGPIITRKIDEVQLRSDLPRRA
jgi:hypothetical protein